MHAERFAIPPATVEAIARTRARGGRIVAVGTTSLRALEAAAQAGELRAGAAETDIFITPGYAFRVVDRLITNFHLPKSTLLMLISAFCRDRPDAQGLRPRHRQTLPFFQLWRCHASRKIDPCSLNSLPPTGLPVAAA